MATIAADANLLSADKPRPAINPILIVVILTIATFMEVLDTSIANISLPHIAGNLSAGQDEVTWVLTSYLVANAIILPISGWLATYFGRKRFYMFCVGVFVVSSLFCGLSTNLGMLIFFRILQGLSGGGLAPSEQSIIADTIPPEKRAMAFAIYGMGLVFAPAIGPTVGGWITDNYSWHWIFFINIPVGFLSLFLTWYFVREPRGTEKEREELKKQGVGIDWAGILLFAAGIGALEIVLDEGNREDWFESQYIVTFAIIALVSLSIGIAWEFYQEHPAVDVRMLLNRNFASSFLIIFVVGFVLFGSTFLLPQMAQALLNYNATAAGTILSPGGFLIMAMMPIVGLLMKKFQARWLILIGLILSALSLWHLTGVNLQADYYFLTYARMFQTLGLAFLFVPGNTAAYTGMPPNKSNSVSALMNLGRNMGGSCGIALLSTLLSHRSQFHINTLSYHTNQYNPNFSGSLNAITQTLTDAGATTATAVTQAHQIIWGQMLKQASMLSFIDAFYVLMWLVIAAIPLVFILKPNKPTQAAGGH